jgi:hypothetical protein
MQATRRLASGRSIFDELSKLPVQTERQKLEAIAEQILSLRLRDYAELQAKVADKLPEAKLLTTASPGRSPFPHPLGFFK